ncbi:sulfotransferase [Rubrivivax gelatinosus]|uniref:sulfotransferase domain-containing protein n=1 Tax=Rubrivivax gelatinosus TaxID=28068 RepID=UPI001907F96E|nr:sulfotransferase domain-containing protein [Rubrivivax gelatinosus]MBK1615620.1 sulfotransferase [Rubrivivax gelatinosus]
MNDGIVWLASYPKSGNTWLRLFLRNLTEDRSEPADINALDDGSIASARLWLDEVLGFDTADLCDDEAERLRPHIYRWTARHETAATPACRKIHDACVATADGEPLTGLGATRAVLYIVRNPLDVAVSAAEHWGCSLDQAIACMGDARFATPGAGRGLSLQVRQRLLSWSAHVASWCDAPGLAREVLRYEDMLAQPLPTFGRAAALLGLPTAAPQLARALQHSRFDELARQEAAAGFRERSAAAPRFFRQGRSGAWRQRLNAVQAARVVADHGPTMRRFGYLDAHGNPS